jgi:hypothetical protein
VSHNSIQAYVDAGRCAASPRLAACALALGDRDTWFDWQPGSRASRAPPLADAALALASQATDRATTLAGEAGRSALAALKLFSPQAGPWRLAITAVVLRRPVDRFVSSLYFWNCERGTFPAVRALLLATPPANLTRLHLATVRGNRRL